jgi:hypothetical protein
MLGAVEERVHFILGQAFFCVTPIQSQDESTDDVIVAQLAMAPSCDTHSWCENRQQAAEHQ